MGQFSVIFSGNRAFNYSGRAVQDLAGRSPCLVFIHKMHLETGEKCIRNFGRCGASRGLVISRFHNRGETSYLSERPFYQKDSTKWALLQ